MDQLINSFQDLARRYCELVEAETPIDPSVFAHECLILLLRLYEAALRLPATDTRDEDAPRISYATWKTMLDSVASRMPGRDSYWTVFEPLKRTPSSPIVGSLADDVADIWRDLKSGLLLIDSGGPNRKNSAVWQWRFSFESHWGRHAVEAITVLHALCIDSSSRDDAA